MREETPRAVTQLIRASYDEKNHQITRLMQFKTTHSEQRVQALERLSVCILSHGNIFEELMYTVRYCSLGEITEALYGMGGKYRRSM
jgi:methylmalonyl-CoA mutase